MARQVQEGILRECKAAQYFSILADETADVSNTEQVSLSLRYVDSTFQVQEKFVTFASTESTTGEALAGLVKSTIMDLGLDLENLVGQGYDGAGNMSGKVKGVQARIQQEYPMAQYVHCKSHNLNLAIGHSCNILPIRNLYTTVGEALFFITASPKRLSVYRSYGDDTSTRLQNFCPTRWSQREESLGTLIGRFGQVQDTLMELEKDKDIKTSTTAAGLFRAMDSFEFVAPLFIAHRLLRYTVPLCKLLQLTDCDLVQASSQATRLRDLYQEKRDNSFFDEVWGEMVEFAAQHDIEVSVPRRAARQIHRNNAPAASPKDHWRVNAFLPFADHVISEISTRLCTSFPRLLAQSLIPQRLSNLTDEEWTQIKTEYGLVLDYNADIELELWRQAVNTGDITGVDLEDAVKASYGLFPNIHRILKILLTMPVSTATAERSFSAMRRLKTYLRSTMSDKRLSSLGLLHVHREFKIDIDQVLKDFDCSGHRRIHMAFQ
ncbi:52 kDa repressor of the inhibitor of the protein kinase [Lingula anatina]|uniref:52 kDa repressor of the inhibitor of the protein kinase n=1 Tax=Lingula anatina TaxID=7574 RepID=A0A1S3H5F5_LINAN|nr:52 kDa repressor of the inhibitor of the protein kinase [Lingula anatina]|eukprot:XP_013381238.1 52 kDa repressor of the inhibitor of the protein kinase [Lingula anatina]